MRDLQNAARPPAVGPPRANDLQTVRAGELELMRRCKAHEIDDAAEHGLPLAGNTFEGLVEAGSTHFNFRRRGATWNSVLIVLAIGRGHVASLRARAPLHGVER